MQNTSIIKTIELDASLTRVWNAITDHEQFGEWFCVKLNHPFISGKKTSGHITYPGYEHLQWEVVVQKVIPETFFSFTWHPYAIDPKVDYSNETPTLVEFQLEKIDACKTRLTVTESGFEKIPAHRLAEALRMNEGGWIEQMKNIEAYLDQE